MPSRIKIDWTQTHHCASCTKELCRRTTKAVDRNGRVVIGRETSTGYECRICQQKEERWGKGTKPMNRAEKSEDGLSQKCNACGNWFDYASHMFRPTKYGHRTDCRDCEKTQGEAWRKENRDLLKDRMLSRRYGVDYRQMLEAQNGLCGICNRTEEENTRERFDVDHDHSCCPTDLTCGQCVRGLLCTTCNLMLGLHQDNLYIIEQNFGGSSWGSSAVQYLTKEPVYNSR